MTKPSKYEEIDSVLSVSQMLREVQSLSSSEQREVILYALANSRCQFTWSWIAQECSIPKSEWPPSPNEMKKT